MKRASIMIGNEDLIEKESIRLLEKQGRLEEYARKLVEVDADRLWEEVQKKPDEPKVKNCNRCGMEYTGAFRNHKCYEGIKANNQGKPIKKTKKAWFVKSREEIEKILKEDGYEQDNNGDWLCAYRLSFFEDMFKGCNNKAELNIKGYYGDYVTGYEYSPKWVEEREIDE